MSASLDRIIRTAQGHSADPSWNHQELSDVRDDWNDSTLSIGDWKDAISTELFTLKKSLEEIAVECDESERWGTAAKLRALAKDL